MRRTRLRYPRPAPTRADRCDEHRSGHETARSGSEAVRCADANRSCTRRPAGHGFANGDQLKPLVTDSHMARDNSIAPDSNGCRSDSSTRRRTPATRPGIHAAVRERISPGFECAPPPTTRPPSGVVRCAQRSCAVQEPDRNCRARNGCAPLRATALVQRRQPANRSASIVLPVPGGLTSNRWQRRCDLERAFRRELA